MKPSPGDVVAKRYRLGRVLGAGSVGSVFQAHDEQQGGMEVALKVLSPEFLGDDVARARFKREGTLAQSLIHPNIVQVLDFGDSEGLSYIVMEYLDGGTLKAKLEKERLPFEEAISYVAQIASGLAHAHEKGIIHRDLKPENLLLTKDGTVKISDFGFARSLLSDERLTKTNEAIGTPLYIPPEMIKSATADYRSDIYSLGIIAFELVEGRPPFFSNHWMTLATLHLQHPLPNFSQKPGEPDVPLWYWEIVKKATEKEPSARQRSASEIAMAIKRMSRSGDGDVGDLTISARAVGGIAILLITGVGVGLWLFL